MKHILLIGQVSAHSQKKSSELINTEHLQSQQQNTKRTYNMNLSTDFCLKIEAFQRNVSEQIKMFLTPGFIALWRFRHNETNIFCFHAEI